MYMYLSLHNSLLTQQLAQVVIIDPLCRYVFLQISFPVGLFVSFSSQRNVRSFVAFRGRSLRCEFDSCRVSFPFSSHLPFPHQPLPSFPLRPNRSVTQFRTFLSCAVEKELKTKHSDQTKQ